MATVNEIKEKLQFNIELTDLLEAMRDIAVFQFRNFQRKKERFARFTESLKGFFKMVGLQKTPHYFINPLTDKVAIAMITSDGGFMGGLNLQVINSSLMHREADKARFMIVGERGQGYLKEIGREFTAFSVESPGSGPRPASGGKEADYIGRYKLALELKNFIAKGVKSGEFGKVIVVYPKCISFMVQKVEVVEVLPIQGAAGRVQGSGGELSLEPDERGLIIESPLEGIIEYLVEEMVLQKLLEVLEESRLSEFAARAIHLEKSSQELAEQQKQIRLQYFRAHHEKIDQNTRELFSAQIIRRKMQLIADTELAADRR